MLLLLFNGLNEDCNKIPESTHNYTIHDLFDVNLGLIEDRYLKLTKNDNEPIMFLRLSSFIDDETRKSKLYLNTYEKLNIIDMKAVISKHKEYEEKNLDNSKKGFIPDQKVLKDVDYLISLRGRPKGYSMLKSIKDNQHKLVSSNHFIHIRPRQTQIEEMYVPYLHLILDMLVEKKINADFEDKKVIEDALNKKYSAYNSFRIQDLRDMEISIPRTKLEQKKAYELFETNYNKYLDANLQYDSFKKCLTSKIIK